MSQLFGKGTIKSHIEVLAGFDGSKIEIIKKLHQDRKNGLLDDESRYEQTFNQIFFGDLLDYEDRKNRIPKGGVWGSGIADLTLGNFTDGKYDPELVQVVCELKGAKSNLTKKQFGHGGLSPVGQGFAYKTGLKNCKRLIVSNFYEIRLYRDNTTDFEVRTLDELLDPKDNYFNLRKLYLLLHRDNLLTGKTEKLLSHFREEQKDITKKFYQEYKELRIRLIQDIRKNNPNLSVTTSVEKAQKIIDRLIFIFFCEDKDLLPDKKLKENIVRAKEAGFSPWEITKKFFTLVDSGSEKLGIPDGYNGGLFKEDSILNSLRISDDICNDFVGLTNYNFDDDISVNILGHIFEQSISDLEEIKEDLIGRETQDNSKGRRKKDGIFYTPEYIVDYIVQNSVMKYLNEKEDECLSEVSTIDEKTGDRRRKKNIENPEQKAYLKYQQILQNIKVLDPACGSGAFLVRVFDVLLEENKRVGSILNSLFDETETYKNILTNNIYGVDLNEESVEITKLSLRLKSTQKGKKLNNLDANIKCGNSLIDDPAVAGDKAFDWNEKFKEIMKNGGFDVIVGNPPYVLCQPQNTEKDMLNFYKNKYEVSSYKIDLFHLFFEKSTNLLKENGCLGFITPNTYLTNKYIQPLRKFLLERTFIWQIVLFETGVFEGASVDTNITIYGKQDKKNRNIDVYVMNKNGYVSLVKSADQNDWLNDKENSFNTNFGIDMKFEGCVLLGDIASITFGLQTKDKGKFVSTHKADDLRENCYTGKDISRYNLSNSTLFFKNVPSEAKAGGSWNMEIHHSKKIVVRQVGNPEPIFAYDSFGYASLNTMYNIVVGDEDYNAMYILSILNSKIIKSYFLQKFGDNKELFPKIKGFQLEQLPIKEISLKDQQPFIQKADKMLSLNKELHELTDKFLHRIQDNLKIEKLTKKLESFYEGEFKDLLDELKKQKISLSLSDQDKREPYFKEYKEKILSLKGEIERTGKEIDEMVYKLYGLTEEEIKVVEGN